MKPRLQTSLGQHLVMTPQLRQAIRLLQLSTAELEVEIASAVESNPLLDWEEPARLDTHAGESGNGHASDGDGDARDRRVVQPTGDDVRHLPAEIAAGWPGLARASGDRQARDPEVDRTKSWR